MFLSVNSYYYLLRRDSKEEFHMKKILLYLTVSTLALVMNFGLCIGSQNFYITSSGTYMGILSAIEGEDIKKQ